MVLGSNNKVISFVFVSHVAWRLQKEHNIDTILYAFKKY